MDCMTCFPFTTKSWIQRYRQSVTDLCSSYATKLVKKNPNTFTYLSKSIDVILCCVGSYIYVFSTTPPIAEDTKRHYLVSLKITQVSSHILYSPLFLFLFSFPYLCFLLSEFFNFLLLLCFFFLLLSVEDTSQHP